MPTPIHVARDTYEGTPYAFFAVTDEAFDAPTRDELRSKVEAAFPGYTAVLVTENGRLYAPGHLRVLYPVTVARLDFVKYDAEELFSEPAN